MTKKINYLENLLEGFVNDENDLNYEENFWNREKIDQTVNDYREEFKRFPHKYEIEKYRPGIIMAIEKGIYDPKVRKWKDYLKNKVRNNTKRYTKRRFWTPNKTKLAFQMIKENDHKKIPSEEEFNIRYISEQRKIIDHEFDRIAAEIKRLPNGKELIRICPGAFKIICAGRYASEVSSLSTYLNYRKLKQNE